MKFTDEMIAEDEARWHARDVVMELGYCSNYMRDRRNITNMDIRFYAYIMRRAHEILKAQEPVEPILKRENKYHNDYVCPVCDQELVYEQNYCSECGRAVKWE